MRAASSCCSARDWNASARRAASASICGGAIALGAQAVGGGGELLLGPLALGGQRGGVRLGLRGGGPLAFLRGLLERADPLDEPLGLRARLVEPRDVGERRGVLGAQLVELGARVLGERLDVLALAVRRLQGGLELGHPVGDLGDLAAHLLELGDAGLQVARLLGGELAVVGAGLQLVELALDRAHALGRALGALGGGAGGDDRLVALALDAAGGLEGTGRLRLARGRDERRLVGLGELRARGRQLVGALGGEGLGARPGVLERLRLRACALELGGDLGGGAAHRRDLGGRLGDLLLGVALLGPGALGRRPRPARRAPAPARRPAPPRRGSRRRRRRSGRASRPARARASRAPRRGRPGSPPRRAWRSPWPRARAASLCTLACSACSRAARSSAAARAARCSISLAGVLERALALALRARRLAARGEHLALALGDRRLELRARLALGGDALVELGARGGDLLAGQARLLLGGGARLLVEGDALGELLGLAVAAAQRRLGLRAQPGDLLARLAGGLLGGAAQAPLGLQAPFERRHRLAALLGRALGDLAAAALLDERRGAAGAGAGAAAERLRLGAAARGLLGARQVDDAAARLQGEGEMAVGQQRGGRRVGGAPGRRIGAGQRGRRRRARAAETGGGCAGRRRAAASAAPGARASRDRQCPAIRSSTLPPAVTRSKRSTSNSGARPLKTAPSLGPRAR